IVKHGSTSSDKFLANNMINMYCKCGCLSYAHQLFDEMPQRDLVTWNSILAAYVSGKIGLDSEVFVSGGLVNVYLKFGKVKEARLMFDEIEEWDRDVMLWNLMLKAYVKVGLREEAFRFLPDFHRSEVVCPDVGSLQCVLNGFAEDIVKHGSISSDKFLANNMINMYCKCGCLSYARQLFDEMPQRDLVTWNSILAAYVSGCEVDGGNAETAISLKNPLIAKSTHAQIVKHGSTSSDKFLANNMINMYGKCGCLSYARQLFDEMPQRDLVTWNSILAAYGSGCEVDGGNAEKDDDGVIVVEYLWDFVESGWPENGDRNLECRCIFR
nr:pentatricopeptide repeat-containing protein At4g33170 [Tanacetum cinerariifolium]